MKKIVIIIAVGMLGTYSFSQKMQEKELPEVVRNTFKKSFPTATDVKWDKEDDKYEASFDLNQKDNSVLFDGQGNITESELEMQITELQQKAQDYVAQNYKGQPIKGAAKITDAKGKITYEAQIKGKDLIFDDQGNFLREIIE